MSRLNTSRTSASRTKIEAVSYNGNPQFVKDAEQQLYELAVMMLYGNDSYYESNDERLAHVRENLAAVVTKGNLDFIANTIIHARTVMNIRALPILLTVLFAAELRNQKKTYANLRTVVRNVIQRADELTDMYAVALQVFGDKRVVPMAIKRGVADAFNKFNEYAFAKYPGKAVKVRDVIQMVHPKANTVEQGAIFEKIVTDTLEVPYTWEVELSRNGQLPESERKSKSALWTELVRSSKVGYMALLRNLRNITEAGVDPSVIDEVSERISNKDEVLKSKQLPFRFINALNSIDSLANAKLTRAVSRAVDISLGNLPKIGDNVWIIVDASGSMEGRPYDTAAMFAAALAKANADATNVKVTLFSDDAMHVNINTDSPVVEIVKDMQTKIYGGGTELQAALNKKKNLGFEPDTVIVLSDMQVNQLDANYATNIFKPGTVKVAIDLQAYGSTPCHEIDGWYQLSGWSERLFDFIPAMRNKQSVVKTLSVPYLGMEVKQLLK